MPHSMDTIIVVFHPVPSQKESDSVTEPNFVLQSRVPEDGMTLWLLLGVDSSGPLLSCGRSAAKKSLFLEKTPLV